MLTSVEGVFRNGHIELAELPEDVHENTQVIVTFIKPSGVNLKEHGISKEQAAELRGRLASFADDWNAPGMEVYDNYE